MKSHAASVLAFLAALTSSAAPAFAALLPDIRGMNFGATPGSFQGVQEFNGLVTIAGLGTSSFDDNPARGPNRFDPYPGVSPVPTFSVAADPSAPTDPTRVDVRTRFGYGSPATPPGEILAWDLIGTYDRTTGAISVSGSRSGAPGSILYDDGPVTNPFGNGANFELILGFTGLTYSLHGTLSQGPNGLTITGSDSAPPLGVRGNVAISGPVAVYFNPVGDYDVAHAQVVGSVAAGDAFGSLTDWSATTAAVPEPASLALCGLAALAGSGCAAGRLAARAASGRGRPGGPGGSVRADVR